MSIPSNPKNFIIWIIFFWNNAKNLIIWIIFIQYLKNPDDSDSSNFLKCQMEQIEWKFDKFWNFIRQVILLTARVTVNPNGRIKYSRNKYSLMSFYISGGTDDEAGLIQWIVLNFCLLLWNLFHLLFWNWFASATGDDTSSERTIYHDSLPSLQLTARFSC